MKGITVCCDGESSLKKELALIESSNNKKKTREGFYNFFGEILPKKKLSKRRGGEYMGSQKILFTVLGVIAVGIVSFFSLSNSRQSLTQSQNAITEEKSEVKSAQTEDAQSDNEFSKRFIAYSDENLKKATENGRAVVFFHAGWCPMCKQAEEDLKANFDKVPSDITILKTDYDTSNELKAKYGITMQDSWVQVDKAGERIVLWNSGGEGLKTLLANLK